MKCSYRRTHDETDMCPPEEHEHQQVSLYGVCVDRELTNLLMTLWVRGVKTKWSCYDESVEEDDRAYIVFNRRRHAKQFYKIVKTLDPLARYEAFSSLRYGWWSGAVHFQNWTLDTLCEALSDPKPYSRFGHPYRKHVPRWLL